MGSRGCRLPALRASVAALFWRDAHQRARSGLDIRASIAWSFIALRFGMPPFLYRCPATGMNVQGWSADEVDDDETYLSMTCLACRQLHLVNPATGKTMGEDGD
jgi:hypothetical protein